jgi:hypothetical protein
MMDGVSKLFHHDVSVAGVFEYKIRCDCFVQWIAKKGKLIVDYFKVGCYPSILLEGLSGSFNKFGQDSWIVRRD